MVLFYYRKKALKKRSLIDSLKGSFTKKAINALFGLTWKLSLKKAPPPQPVHTVSSLTLFVPDNIILAPIANRSTY